jgi:hypothetical protein
VPKSSCSASREGPRNARARERTQKTGGEVGGRAPEWEVRSVEDWREVEEER